MFTIQRELHFSYGHRLLNHPGKCARLHGHNGRAVIELTSDNLDELNMVADFSVIRKKIGAWIDEHLDHQMILSEKDPLVSVLEEKGEPIKVMNENPTAEALARWIYLEAKKQGLPVSKVILWETFDSCASYAE